MLWMLSSAKNTSCVKDALSMKDASAVGCFCLWRTHWTLWILSFVEYTSFNKDAFIHKGRINYLDVLSTEDASDALDALIHEGHTMWSLAFLRHAGEIFSCSDEGNELGLRSSNCYMAEGSLVLLLITIWDQGVIPYPSLKEDSHLHPRGPESKISKRGRILWL